MSLIRGSACALRILCSGGQQLTNQNIRNIARWVAPTLKEIRKRKNKMAPSPPVKRSGFIDWNWNAELFAFSKRLHEDFNPEFLQEAFTVRSYIIQEEQKQQAVGIENPVTNLKDNLALASSGTDILSAYAEMFISSQLPKLPINGVRAVRDYLLSDGVLANVSRHIGTKDLILTAEFPPDKPTLANTFKAVVSALNKSSGNEKSFEFVRDFLFTQLNQKDIDSMWDIERPIELLQEYCRANKFAEPEPRLLNDAGKNTIMAVYHVGIYCDRKMLAAGFGENVNTAIEVAAINCLKRFYDIENPRPYNFKITLKEVEESLQNRRKVERQV
ncbi:39S ribosomal protein L44, mitochondrial-like [Bradysia coprophila]|uniref:39S ribosomal protein L44, mitochondrial-like n=1 Tax=Bradysia coprophila TaxID=38358 RepID=UPI00187D99FF|nr:39S ribosomal protein L44, mitochondrial-like [Bradysia coprophila]